MKHPYTYLCCFLLAGAPALAQTPLTFTPLNGLPSGGRYGMDYCQDAAAFYMVGGGSPATAYNADVFRYEPTLDVWTPGSATSSLTPQRLGTMAPATNVPASRCCTC